MPAGGTTPTVDPAHPLRVSARSTPRAHHDNQHSTGIGALAHGVRELLSFIPMSVSSFLHVLDALGAKSFALLSMQVLLVGLLGTFS